MPGKSMRMLLGKPVIAYTVEHLKESKCISHRVVSSDDCAVLDFARSEGLWVIERPAELATDTAATDPVLRHAVREVKQSTDFWPDAVVMLYGNVPVRKGGMIDRCIAMLMETGCDSVQTIAPVGKMHPYWMFDREASGRIRKHVANDVFRRQDLPALYSPTGAVYVMRTEVLMAAEGSKDPHAFLGVDRRGLVVGAEDSVDIDTLKDLYVAEAVLRMEAEGQAK